MERRAGGEVVQVEVAPGVVIVVAAWMLDPAACAGNILDHNVMAKSGREQLCNQPGRNIRWTAGREGHDDFDRSLRI